MHIIWFTTQFPVGEDNRNGMFIYRTVKELAKKYDLTVIALHPVIPPFIPILKNLSNSKNIYSEWRAKFPKSPVKPNDAENLNIIYSNYFRPPRPRLMFLESWGAYFNAKKILRSINDKNIIIHANWIFPEGYLAYIFSKKYKIPFILTLRGGDFIYLNDGSFNSYFAKKVIASAHKVTAVAESLLREAEDKNIDIPKTKFAVTNNIYNFEKFNILSREESREILKLNTDKKIIFFAGALRKIKNIYLLLNSLEILVKKEKGLYLILAGYGYEENNLKKFVTDKNLSEYVNFVGNLEPDKLIDYYNAADILCLPSFSEGFPNVVVEALMCGTPVVASSVGGIPKIVKHNENGYLIDPNSLKEMTDALSNALERNWDRQKLRNSISFLRPEKVLTQYKNIYKEIFNNNLERE